MRISFNWMNGSLVRVQQFMAHNKLATFIFIPSIVVISISAIQLCRRHFSEKMSETAIEVFLRHDQRLSMRNKDQYQDQNVSIYTFAWTIRLLRQLIRTFPENINVTIKDGEGREELQRFNPKMPMTLKDLIMICRNEAQNVDGHIAFNQYQIPESAILTLKDLIRHVVILGEDETTFYGGYPRHQGVKQQAKVILIDLIGLQFQQDYNSGRLVLIGKDLPEGMYDDLIYEQIVGEPKFSYEQAASDTSGRYVEVDKTYFDTLAYQKFVANDFLLVCTSLNHFTKNDVNLKFLKYGTGFFAGEYKSLLEKHISKGVALGLKKVLDLKINTRIKAIEFPFYEEDAEIKRLCSENNLECVFSRDDALKRTYEDKMDATTNCADPHVVTGNEMGYSSVDAAIAQNLKSYAITFSPAINTKMQAHIIKENGAIVLEENHVGADSHL